MSQPNRQTSSVLQQPPDQRVVLHDVPWEQYEQLVLWRGESSVPRLTYFESRLEIMSPGSAHESIAARIGSMVEQFALYRGLVIDRLKSWTQRRADLKVGLEPDECFVLGGEKKELPDLAIEVDWTRGSINKLDIYRALGVKEVWIWQDNRIRVYALTSSAPGHSDYVELDSSRLIPGLDLRRVEVLVQAETSSHALAEFRRELETTD